MIPTIQLTYDEQDVDNFVAYYMNVGRKLARAGLVPILKEHLDPMVSQEKAYLAGHSKSGALAGSLASRAGPGDRPGTVSVFAAATATPKQLASTWGKKTSTPQKQGYMKNIKKKTGRRKIFYADFVEKGHRIVKKKADGTAYVAGSAPAYPFARQAVNALGDQQADAAGKAVLDFILG